jgi:hypothetical protein
MLSVILKEKLKPPLFSKIFLSLHKHNKSKTAYFPDRVGEYAVFVKINQKTILYAFRQSTKKQ